MNKHIVTIFLLVFAVTVQATTFNREIPVRQHGKEAGMLLDLGKISLGTLNDVEEKKQYLSTVQLEKQRIQNYTLRMVYENAYQLYKQGDYQRAQEMAQTILSIDPNFKQAQTLAKQANHMGTYGTISEQQVIDAKFQETIRLYDSGRLVEANDKLNEILTIQPGNSKALSWKRKIDYDIAQEYARRGDEAEKLGDYQKAVDAWYNSLLMRKDDQKLLTKIAAAEEELRKQQVQDYMQQAMNFYNKGQYVEAYSVFERITKIQPGDPRVQKYMSQLKNEIAASYYDAGVNSYNAYRFDQAIAYWNNSKKWGADSSTMDTLIRQARTAKESYAAARSQRIVEIQREQAALKAEAEAAAAVSAKAALAEAEAKIEEVRKQAEMDRTDTMIIDGPDTITTTIPGATTTTTTTTTKTVTTSVGGVGVNETLPGLSGTGATQPVSAEARAASRAKYIEGLDAFNQDDYERARQAFIIAKQLDPGNVDAELGLLRVEENLK